MAPVPNETAARGTWRRLGIGFDAALARLPAALADEGFGIITEIDLQQTFRGKLGVDFRRYRIFGACSPAVALQALAADLRVGLLLPCNVVLYEQDDKTAMLGIVDPVLQLGVVGGKLDELAETMSGKLERVARSIDS